MALNTLAGNEMASDASCRHDWIQFHRPAPIPTIPTDYRLSSLHNHQP
jgi:hypothetical protein